VPQGTRVLCIRSVIPTGASAHFAVAKQRDRGLMHTLPESLRHAAPPQSFRTVAQPFLAVLSALRGLRRRDRGNHPTPARSFGTATTRHNGAMPDPAHPCTCHFERSEKSLFDCK
jgi:hypothetical protein